jgi:hypothetical protein
MIDVSRLDSVRSFLRAYPEYHNQAQYTCNTTGCAAGWTVALEHGLKVGTRIESKIPDSDEVFCEARDLLGLTEEEAQALFIDTAVEGGPFAPSNEDAALDLMDAFINREKGELTEDDCRVLQYYGLRIE